MKGDSTDRSGSWAVIAEASDGPGAKFARELARRGMNCALVARRTEKLAEPAEELQHDRRVDTRCDPVDSPWAKVKPASANAACPVIGSTDTQKCARPWRNARSPLKRRTWRRPPISRDGRWTAFADGPALAFDAATDATNLLISPAVRRAQVGHTTRLMNFFYR